MGKECKGEEGEIKEEGKRRGGRGWIVSKGVYEREEAKYRVTDIG